MDMIDILTQLCNELAVIVQIISELFGDMTFCVRKGKGIRKQLSSLIYVSHGMYLIEAIQICMRLYHLKQLILPV